MVTRSANFLCQCDDAVLLILSFLSIRETCRFAGTSTYFRANSELSLRSRKNVCIPHHFEERLRSVSIFSTILRYCAQISNITVATDNGNYGRYWNVEKLPLMVGGYAQVAAFSISSNSRKCTVIPLAFGRLTHRNIWNWSRRL